MDLDLDFLRELCLCPAPSGFEGTVQAVLRRRLDGVAETYADPLGNLWATPAPKPARMCSPWLTPIRSA